MGRSRRNRTTIGRIIVCVCLTFFAFIVQAHPHAWIYVGTTFIMNAEGRITAIEQNWGYDNLLTDALLDELAHGSPGKTPDLASWAAETIHKLRPFNYFLKVTVDGKPVPVGEVTQFNGDLQDEGLRLRFTAPLLQALDPSKHKVELAVFDPAFHIEILQFPETPPRVQGDTRDRCEVSLAYPEPSTEDFLRAISIDRGAKVEPQFGALFVETVRLDCH